MGHGERVLDPGVPVLNQGLVEEQQRRAFGYHHHLQLARRLHDHLPDVAPLLVVALDAEGANGLHPPQVRQRVIVVLDDRLQGQLGSIEDGSRREQPR